MFGLTKLRGPDAKPKAPKNKLLDPVLLGAGCGIVEGTLVTTHRGLTPMEAVSAGDELMTFDGGMQPVLAVLRDQLWAGVGECPEALWPLLVSAGTIDNENEMLVMPHQGILIETDEITDQWGDPFAVVPAAALQVLPGVEKQRPYGTVEVMLPIFEEDQMVFAENGSLMFCQSHWGVSAGFLPKHDPSSNYNMLPLSVATRLLQMEFATDRQSFAVA